MADGGDGDDGGRTSAAAPRARGRARRTPPRGPRRAARCSARPSTATACRSTAGRTRTRRRRAASSSRRTPPPRARSRGRSRTTGCPRRSPPPSGTRASTRRRGAANATAMHAARRPGARRRDPAGGVDKLVPHQLCGLRPQRDARGAPRRRRRGSACADARVRRLHVHHVAGLQREGEARPRLAAQEGGLERGAEYSSGTRTIIRRSQRRGDSRQRLLFCR